MKQMMLIAPAVPLLLAAGCATRPPQLERPVEHVAAEAAGLGEAIHFRVEGITEGDAAEALLRSGGDGAAALTLPTVVRQALLTDPAVQVALAEVRQAQAEAWQERLLPNPVLSVVFRFPEEGGPPVIEAGVAAELLSLLRRPARIDAADARFRAAAAGALLAVLDVVEDVQLSFAEVQALEASVPFVRRRQELVARVLDLERSRFEGGEASRLELVTLQAQQVELETELDALLLELRQAKLAMASRLGVPRSDLSWRLTAWEVPPYASVREDAWIEAALEHRPELQQRLHELAALGVEDRLARSWLLDEIEAGVEAERADSAWEVGPGLATPIPLFDWGQAQRAGVRARQTQAAQQLLAMKRQVVEEVRQRAAAFNESVHRLDRVRTALVPLAEQRTELAEQGFRAGQTDAVTLLLAEQDLARARQRLIELERQTAESLAQLQRAIGGPGRAATLVARDPEAVSSDIHSIHEQMGIENRSSAPAAQGDQP